MASSSNISSKRGRVVDYKQLNSFSSAVLYDSVPKKKRMSKFYEVERVITRRRVPYDHEYLIKWRRWSLEFCSWEPTANFTADLLENYEKPKITDERLQEACREFSTAITTTLKSRSSLSVFAKMDLDTWRNVTNGKGEASEHKGHYLFGKDAFVNLKYLPVNWWYHLNENGTGTAVDFLVKIKPVLTWSPQTYVKTGGEFVKARTFPVERICITAIRRACNINNI